jgi:tetratricopeptide (TPR) repeat protein
LADLFQGATADARAQNVWDKNSSEQLLEYARLVLERARDLNPGNKDHYANLGRLFALWYGFHKDPAKLDQSLSWYAAAHAVAPNDVVILDEWAGTEASLGPSKYADVEAKFKQSEKLDPRFADTYAKLGNLYRVMGKNDLAAGQYVEAIKRRGNVLDDGQQNSLDPAIAAFKSDPAALQRLLAAYRAAAKALPKDAQVQSGLARVAAASGDPTTMRAAFDQAISVSPDDVRLRQQYTVALSETQQYDAALQQAQAGLQLAQTQQSKSDIDRLTQLVSTIQRRKAAGGS